MAGELQEMALSWCQAPEQAADKIGFKEEGLLCSTKRRKGLRKKVCYVLPREESRLSTAIKKRADSLVLHSIEGELPGEER